MRDTFSTEDTCAGRRQKPGSATRTTRTMALNSNGAENTSEMNIPLESKYWYFENNLF